MTKKAQPKTLKVETGQEIFTAIDGVWDKHCSSYYNATEEEVQAMAKETEELSNKRYIEIEGLVTFLEERKKRRILHHPEDDLINELLVLLGARKETE